MPIVLSGGQIVGITHLATDSSPPVSVIVVAAGTDNLLLETGDNALLETGDLLLTE